jgi:hypothetical protein
MDVLAVLVFIGCILEDTCLTVLAGSLLRLLGVPASRYFWWWVCCLYTYFFSLVLAGTTRAADALSSKISAALLLTTSETFFGAGVSASADMIGAPAPCAASAAAFYAWEC